MCNISCPIQHSDSPCACSRDCFEGWPKPSTILRKAANWGRPWQEWCICYIRKFLTFSFAIDQRTCNAGLPVRSAVLKPCAGRLVVGWVTTSEYLLLIVLLFSFSP